MAEKTAGDDAWSALGTGMNGEVKAIAISGNDVYVGGKSAQGIAKYSAASYKVYLPLVLRTS